MLVTPHDFDLPQRNNKKKITTKDFNKLDFFLHYDIRTIEPHFKYDYKKKVDIFIQIRQNIQVPHH